MARYKVTMIMDLNDCSHPRKWVPDTINEALMHGENVEDIEYELLEDCPNDDQVTNE